MLGFNSFQVLPLPPKLGFLKQEVGMTYEVGDLVRTHDNFTGYITNERPLWAEGQAFYDSYVFVKERFNRKEIATYTNDKYMTLLERKSSAKTFNKQENVFSLNKEELEAQMLDINEIVLNLNLKKTTDGYHGQCPCCGYKSGFSLREANGKILIYCHACQSSQSDLWKSINSNQDSNFYFSEKNFAKVAKVAKVSNSNQAFLNLWHKSVPAKATLVEKYLNSRKLSFYGEYSDIRFLERGFHKESEKFHPAMLCAIRSVTGEISGVHRTFLREDGLGKIETICKV